MTTSQPQIDDLQQKFHIMVKQMAEFTALYETVAGDMQHRESQLSRQLASYQQFIEDKMRNLEIMLTDFESILTQAGAARWRLAAEQALMQGDAHLARLQETCESFHAQVQTACYGIDRTSKTAAERLNSAANSLRLDDLQAITQQTSAKVDKVSTEAIKKIASVAHLFHWERFGMAVIVALLSALVTGMFINDETPIESHKNALAERQAGRVLMAAWPKLDESDRERINRVAEL